MIKTTLKLDVQEIVNEIVGRFDADIIHSFSDCMANEDKILYDADGTPMVDTDDLSNIVNDVVKSVLDELDGKELS